MKDKEKTALFIDADNAPAAKIDVILSELARWYCKYTKSLRQLEKPLYQTLGRRSSRIRHTTNTAIRFNQRQKCH